MAECSVAVHDTYTVVGPDGNTYKTWHPQVDPTTGCTFGHEHGSNPATSVANNTLPPFGYAQAVAGLPAEPHEGHKVFVISKGEISDTGVPFAAHYRVVFHMGTRGLGRYTGRFHSAQFDYLKPVTQKAAHIYGLFDTSDFIGSVCDNPRQGGRDFATLGCYDNSPYEIWAFTFKIVHPDDPYQGITEVRWAVSGPGVAAFDPITTRDPADNTRLIYTQSIFDPANPADPEGTTASYRGCKREVYGGPVYWNNAGKPTTYYTDAYGTVVAVQQPGPGKIAQFVSASNVDDTQGLKKPEFFCGLAIHSPN